MIAQIGPVAYELEVPPTAAIHPVFHVSQLKKVVSNLRDVHPLVPFLTENVEWEAIPAEIFGYRKHPSTKEWEVLIRWQGLPPHEATWEIVMISLNNFLISTLRTRCLWRGRVMIDHQLFYNIVGGKREQLHVNKRREIEKEMETALVGTEGKRVGG